MGAELEGNRQVWQDNAIEASRIKKVLETNVKVVRALRSHGRPEGTLDYSNSFRATRDGAWQSAQQNGSLALMPHDELTNEAWFYRMLRDQLDSQVSLISTMKIAAAFAAAAPPDKLDPQELEALEHSTIEAQGRLDLVRILGGQRPQIQSRIPGIGRGRVDQVARWLRPLRRRARCCGAGLRGLKYRTPLVSEHQLAGRVVD